MPYIPKQGLGAIFKNNRKTKENQPDMSGDANIEGTIFQVAAWTGTTRNGEKYLSLSFKVKEDYPPKTNDDFVDDDDGSDTDPF